MFLESFVEDANNYCFYDAFMSLQNLKRNDK